MIKRNKKICKECKTEQFLFSGGLCKNCWAKEHPPNIKRTPILQDPSYTIPKVSKKQSNRNSKYLKLRAEYLEKHPICEVCKIEEATQIHHKGGRVGEALFNDFLAVCEKCHHRIEMEPEWAKQEGYSINRLN